MAKVGRFTHCIVLDYAPLIMSIWFLATVSEHKGYIETAKRECRDAPWYKKYICIGTAAKIAYHGLAIGGLYVAYGTAKVVLKAAEYFLKGVQALVKVSTSEDLTTISFYCVQ